MTKKSEETRQATHRLEDVEVFKVDIVGRPATGDRFMVVRSEESEGDETMPKRRRQAMTKEAVEALRESNPEGESVPVVARQESVEVAIDGAAVAGAVVRQVPPSDAPTDRKRKSQKRRSEKYGIEVLEGKGENLSYPSGDPTTERLYGDPVNLKYPLGRDDNELDVARANNARARFKQAYAVYSKTASRRVIHTRIVEAQLRGGANPSYDPDDALDKLLPKKIKDRLQKPVERTDTDEPETISEETQMKDLNEAINRVEGLVERMESVFSGALGLTATAPDASGEIESQTEPEGETPSEPESIPEPELKDSESEETPQEPTEQPEASEDTPEPTPEETPVVTDSAPDPAQLDSLSESVAGLTAVVERMGEAFRSGIEGLETTVKGIVDRVDRVERSVRSGGNSEQDGTEGPVERGDNEEKPGIWAGILR